MKGVHCEVALPAERLYLPIQLPVDSIKIEVNRLAEKKEYMAPFLLLDLPRWPSRCHH